MADRTSYYLSSRTGWLAPVGAVGFTIAVIGASWIGDRTKAGKDELRLAAILAVPALTLLLLPPLTLGSFAAERRSAAGVRGGAVASGVDLSASDLSLGDIFALGYTGSLSDLEQVAGNEYSFTGFVSRDGSDGADEFRLNRFLISCCPGDAVTVTLRVVGAPAGRFRPDDWVRVTGALYPIGKEVLVDATNVVHVDRPESPYLNP
ncbi:MAG: TIGR03943 family putative permease subunit [Actinomycetota bacterium]